jgi:hypothetical protein
MVEKATARVTAGARRSWDGEATPEMKILLTAAGLAAALIAFAPQGHAQSAPKYFFEGDIVMSGKCVLNSQFKRGERVAFRVRVTDPKGQPAGDKKLKSLVVVLPDGKQFPMHYGAHPPGGHEDDFWSSSWGIPADYPTGTFAYKVIATDVDDQSQTWAPFSVQKSELTIVE